MPKRLETIFDMLEGGNSVAEIEDVLDSRQETGKAQLERGAESERMALDYFNGLKFVAQAKIVSHNAKVDNRKRDIKVVLDKDAFQTIFGERLCIPNNFVWIQVKSCDSEVRRARRRIMERCGLENPEELDLWLYRKRLIFLNIRRPKEETEYAFRHDVRMLNEYYSNQTNFMSQEELWEYQKYT